MPKANLKKFFYYFMSGLETISAKVHCTKNEVTADLVTFTEKILNGKLQNL